MKWESNELRPLLSSHLVLVGVFGDRKGLGVLHLGLSHLREESVLPERGHPPPPLLHQVVDGLFEVVADVFEEGVVEEALPRDDLQVEEVAGVGAETRWRKRRLTRPRLRQQERVAAALSELLLKMAFEVIEVVGHFLDLKEEEGLE